VNLLHYGLQRSGTNFLETLITKWYQVLFLNKEDDRSSPLHKHFRLYNEKEMIPEPQYRNEYFTPDFASFERLLDVVPSYYLVISKDPYSWLISYKNWARKCNWPKVSHHYISEYNLFYGKWLEFSKQTEKIVFVRYIDLLRDAAGEMSKIELKIGLTKKTINGYPSRSIGKVEQSEEFSNDRRNYYINENFLETYTGDELHEINCLLDKTVMTQLDYEQKGTG
jgi:hypothetical protein